MKKFLIAYYSRTGGTEKMAVRIQNELEKRDHEVKIERIKLEKELSSWILLILDFLIMFQFLFELIVKKESLQRMEIKPLLYPDV
ncbi:MAG: flavodoxin family protein, partial [Candidatus Andersenbacteria bacterium]|nr:flavodoxin family protein [Candidatus Andersenbacteria bacterium]